VSYKRGNLK